MEEWLELESGSVTSPKGFLAAGIAAGLKRSGRPDMALLLSQAPAAAAGAFTSNRFAAAPVEYDRAVLRKGRTVRAVLVNSGNANACTGPAGLEDAGRCARHAAERLGLDPDEVLVASTGRIGVRLPMERMLAGIDRAVAALSPAGGAAAAEAIMTTDTRPKSIAVEMHIAGRPVRIGGMVKGAGMIAPRMQTEKTGPLHATMLAFVTTDAAADAAVLEHCLATGLERSFNRITVDGDMSTNDTVLLLANGASGAPRISLDSPEAARFRDAVEAVLAHLARAIVLDGEGATKFVQVHVAGAASDAEARRCAAAIADSLLCKTAWFGGDPNWGRVLAAAGRAGVKFDPANVSLDYNGVPIVRNGTDAGRPEEQQAAAMAGPELRLDLDLGAGPGQATVWTCDLSYDYVKINAEYHT